jgi:pimeloyl-ACP methyl ester carboxylesterase
MNEPTGLTVEHDGGRLHVRDHQGTSPAIVAMHGFPDDSRIYNRLVSELAPQRVVTFDWTGYGKSSRRKSERFTAADRQRDIQAVLDGLDLHRAVLVAHDAAGPEAIDFTVAHPERITSLVLLNTYYGRSPNLRLPEFIALMADPALTPLTDALLDDSNQRLWLLAYTARRLGLGDDLPPDGIAATSILPQFFGDANQSDALAEIRAWTGDLPQALTRQDRMIASGSLQIISVPVLVAFGRDDQNLNHEVAQHISSLFTNAELHVVDQASHWPQWDRPNAIADLIKQSLAAAEAPTRQ